MKTAVIYKSNYGSTQQYAQWIAEELNADLLNRKEVAAKDLAGYDLIIYGGGLYASGILGIDLVTKNPCPALVVFTVGAANPATTNYANIIKTNLPQHMREGTKVFHLRGALNYKKLGTLHRILMAMKKKMSVGDKKYEDMTAEEKEFWDTYGKKADFVDKETIAPLVKYVQELGVK